MARKLGPLLVNGHKEPSGILACRCMKRRKGLVGLVDDVEE